MQEAKWVMFQSAKYPTFQALYLSHMEEIKWIKKKKKGRTRLHSKILMCLELRTYVTISLEFSASKVWYLRRLEERAIQGLKQTLFSKPIFK